jgi:signal transduction histidine kinase
MLAHVRDESTGEVEALRQLIDWFHHSSLQLSQEYRRLEDRIVELNSELERKNQALEKSLREREEARAYLLSVLESLKAGVLVLDENLCPTFVNSRLRELAGEVDEERAAQLVGERLALCLERGERDFLPLECERVLRRPDGMTTPVHLTISEVILAEEERSGYALVFQDISRLKRLEAEAARSRRLAALGEMAASIAHEVRSPLGGIELYASLLKEQEGGEAQRLSIEILKAVQRLHTTISHLLSFAGEPHIAGEVFPASLLFREVVELTAPLLRGDRYVLKTEVDSELPPLWGDRRLLAQALINLVANAIDAMPHGGTVRLSARRSPFSSANGRIHREIEIRVTDEGVGISPENRERIFDPFFSTKPKGTGLGLALTHKIICAHTGSIEVSSVPGQGSCFTVFLPVADGSKVGSPAIRPATPERNRLCGSVLS